MVLLNMDQFFDLDTPEQYNRGLVASARVGNLPMVKFLVNLGADINTGQGSALTSGSMEGHLPIVQYLVQHGAKIDGNDLVASAMRGHLDVVKYLVEHGANVQHANNSALGQSAVMSHLPTVKYLVEHGADVRAQDGGILINSFAYGQPLDVAEYIFQQDIPYFVANPATVIIARHLLDMYQPHVEAVTGIRDLSPDMQYMVLDNLIGPRASLYTRRSRSRPRSSRR